MTQKLSFITKALLGPGAVMEDENPTPMEFRVKGAKSAAPVEAETPIDSQADNQLSPTT